MRYGSFKTSPVFFLSALPAWSSVTPQSSCCSQLLGLLTGCRSCFLLRQMPFAFHPNGVHCNLTGPHGIFNVKMAFRDIFFLITCSSLLAFAYMVFVCVWGSSLCSWSLFHCLMRGDRLSARLKPNPPSSPSHVSRHPTAAEAFFKMRPRIAHVRARARELCPSLSSLQSFDSYLLRQV